MNQKSQEIIIALGVLETIFSPLSDEKAKIYAEQLLAFDLSTIKAGIKRVAGKWDRVSFPPPGVIVKECEAISGSGTGVTRNGSIGGKLPWVKRDDDIRAMVDPYVHAFMRNTIGDGARLRGYENEMRRYIHTVAFAQAQLIIPTSDKRFSIEWWLIDEEGVDAKEIEKAHYRFTKDILAIAARGSIDVAIPMHKYRQWEKQAQFAAAARENERSRMSRKYGQSLEKALPKPDALAELLPPMPAEDSAIMAEWQAEAERHAAQWG